MASDNGKQRGFSRRKFIKGAAAAAASGTLLASSARAAKEHDSREHEEKHG